jgi:hypothetical protein
MDKIDRPDGNAECYLFDYPSDIVSKIGIHGMTMSKRELWETVAGNFDKADPKSAAFYREVALHYPECDSSGYAIERNSLGAILFDYDDWDDLSSEEKLTRGNINAAIAAVDRLRAYLERMSDDPSNGDEIDEIRRSLGDILEDRC